MSGQALEFQRRWQYTFDFEGEAAAAQVQAWQRQALRTGRRRRVYCRGDVFSPGTEALLQRESLWQLIEDSPDLDWLLLTDFPELAREQFPHDGYWRNPWGQLPANVLIGMRCNSLRDSERLPLLLSIPAQRRFLVHDRLETALLYPFAHVYRRVEGVEQEMMRCKGVEQEMMRCKRCGSGVWDGAPTCHNCHSTNKLEWNPSELLHWVLIGLDDSLPASEQERQWAEQLLSYYHQIGIPCFSRPGQLLHLQQLPEEAPC
ncbi:DUF5131 family protein [Hymenobacter endophyticus]|uniref:DUF5131 family protein n=1 Tax=Hymenobacter endophyticus TaxID=3076335 RepID=A0ABU3TKX3_9BACT|nr:DUF5131 family protein [Hymenobacter endophyticus]MDU0371982.1 DUF5131 family protein [Hymenobacter endophyticus]